MSRKSQLRPIMSLLRKRRATNEQGATAIEYALIAAGVGATIAATVWNMGSTLKTVWWDKIGNAI